MTTARLQSWVAACLVISAGSGLLKAGEVPTYAPKPGQVLTYEENQTFKGKGENSAYRTTWRIWVVGKERRRELPMVVREAMKTLGEGASSGERRRNGDARPHRPPSRRHRSPHTARSARDSTQRSSFPRLPGDDKESTAGWKAHDDRDDATIAIRADRTQGERRRRRRSISWRTRARSWKGSTRGRTGARSTSIGTRAWSSAPRSSESSART